MTDEYVEVKFLEERKVFIDGRHNGFTNKIIRIDEGEYTFAIQGDDFTPKEIIKYIQHTNSLNPEIIKFEQVTS